MEFDARLAKATEENNKDVSKELTNIKANAERQSNEIEMFGAQVANFEVVQSEIKSGMKELTTNSKGTGNKGKSLANPSETSVDKLAEGVTRANFVSWVNELYMHLDGMPG